MRTDTGIDALVIEPVADADTAREPHGISRCLRRYRATASATRAARRSVSGTPGLQGTTSRRRSIDPWRMSGVGRNAVSTRSPSAGDGFP
ncbi:MAG: hypothetical protein OXG65_10840 [Chloroflexi bacterium]|nr:hypothetical protein [Chloroflexota bacterium]